MFEPPANGITQNKDSDTKVEMIDLDNEPQAQPNPLEIVHEDVFYPPANGITQNKDSNNEVEMVDVDKDEPKAQPNALEIIELSDDDDDDDDKNDNRDDQHYDPKKVMWFYEFPKGKTYGPFSLTELKQWNEEDYFVAIPDFKVWMRGESMKSAVSLTKLLAPIKT